VEVRGGRGAPRVLDYPLVSVIGDEMYDRRAFWVSASLWFNTPLATHRRLLWVANETTHAYSLSPTIGPTCPLPHFSPACGRACTLDAALAQLAHEVLTP
jgi:hypothetical protein